MANCIDVVAPEQLCYIPCKFCNIVLALSVPCNNLFDIVTIRCGNCANLWSVNMAAAFQTLPWQDLQAPNLYTAPDQNQIDSGSSSVFTNKVAKRPPPSNPTREMILNRAPQKKQRVPSAYNQFIKEEIKRIKLNNPDISHREAFSTAAKNWAHFPRIHFGLMLEMNNQSDLDNAGI